MLPRRIDPRNEVDRILDAVKRKRETLEFVQQMLRELRDMTLAEKEAMTAYLIEMAYVEISDVIRHKHTVKNAPGAGHER